MAEIKDGVACNTVYNKALAAVKSKFPELVDHFVKSVGYGIGIEGRDSSLNLSAKNTKIIRAGMTLCVSVGFHNLENPKPQDKQSKTYSLLLIDTVRVTNGDVNVLTGACSKDNEHVAFYFKDEPEEKVKEKKAAPKQVTNTAILKTKLRGERKEVDEGSEQRRKEHQKALHEAKQQEGLERYAKEGESGGGDKKKAIKRFESYKRDAQLPSSVKDLKIVVDVRNQTIILPIFGRPVPFHIATVKNVSKSDEDEFTYLRINLLSPGQGVGRKDDLVSLTSLNDGGCILTDILAL
jgi:nucleosome binding factor SPN SPT16 subunit